MTFEQWLMSMSQEEYEKSLDKAYESVSSWARDNQELIRDVMSGKVELHTDYERVLLNDLMSGMHYQIDA